MLCEAGAEDDEFSARSVAGVRPTLQTSGARTRSISSLTARAAYNNTPQQRSSAESRDQEGARAAVGRRRAKSERRLR